jgi:hypothetical protein
LIQATSPIPLHDYIKLCQKYVSITNLAANHLLLMQVYAHRGIVPRAMHRIFQEKETKPEAGIRVQMSYVEVYNEVDVQSRVYMTFYKQEESQQVPL